LKILIVNYSDNSGGAARAAYRLHRGLLSKNIASSMLVIKKTSGDYSVIGPKSKYELYKGKLRNYLDSLLKIKYSNRSKTVFSVNITPFSGLVKKINSYNADIVHLHWVCSAMLNIMDIYKINAPIVWSLHDVWPLTGGCHYSEGCNNYKNSCGYCKVLKSTKKYDISAFSMFLKKRSFNKKTDVTINGLSSWISKVAAESAIFKNHRITNLPNMIDTILFSPIDKMLARKILNLPTDKKIVLFGAMGPTSDPRKGYKELKNSLDYINCDDIELVIFGSSTPQYPDDFKLKAHYLGQVNDDILLKIVYSSADTIVVPSLEENLSNVIMESLSCALPVVAFDIGGNSDMIKHKVNGYLANLYETNDLSNGIMWVLKNNKIMKLSINAREHCKSTFDQNVVAVNYINLYKMILNSA